MKLTSIPALLIAASQLIPSALAENWPHWRGEGGNSVSTTASPPTQWSENKNVKWKVRVPGKGSGSPIIWNERIFVTTAVPQGGPAPATATPGPDQRSRSRRSGRGGQRQVPLQTLEFKLLCFNKSDGTLLWEKTATVAKPHEGTHSTNGFASASPCTDGESVFAHFGSRGLFCYSLKGDLKWKREDLGRMETRAGFGEGSSPTLASDRIIVPWDHEGQSSIMAIDKVTGNTIWRTPREEPTCWATPLIVEHEGRQQVVMNGQNYARAYDLKSGKELWRCSGQTERPVACAVSADGLIVIGSGHRGSFMGAFRAGGEGDIAGSPFVQWTVNRDTPDIASPVLSANRLFFHKGKSGVLSCIDVSTGETLFAASRIPGLSSIYASPIAAGGHVYLTGRSGTTVVIKDSDKLEIVATNSVGETVDATPAPVDDQLFIRGEQHLFCISE